ncbi:SAP30-binding protein [Rhynchophorus ferrugineus]|uniref:SAP30-binding protein n=1 Tax=Rhynchophorus ferrugineus TaxID=354439 RepID=A0A834M6S5_RHYFE|nr:hypothetical protein GWI33_014592 [Rhynchophorus ferrugineus]
MSTSALASLTATYTDSEGEEEEHEEETTTKSPEAAKSPTESISDQKSTTSSRPSSPSSVSTVFVKSKLAKLVSYHDDTIASDDEAETEDIPQQIIVLNDSEKPPEPEPIDEYGHLIPPEPPGNCSADVQDKIAKLYERMQTQKMDMNSVIQKRKDFRNPSIYEKLIQFCELNELGTNYPPEIYDPLKWHKESFYDKLAEVQMAEMEKREKDRKKKVEFLSGTKRAEEERKKRKSKWDMPGGTNMKVTQPGLVAPPTLTTAATGTKSTVISAFGSLPKKPKL